MALHQTPFCCLPYADEPLDLLICYMVNIWKPTCRTTVDNSVQPTNADTVLLTGISIIAERAHAVISLSAASLSL